MMKEDIQVLQKSKAFAVRIIRLSQHLTEEKKEKVVVLGINLELTESDIKKLKNVVMDYL